MEIWDGHSRVRTQDAVRAPAGLDYSETIWQIQETQRQINTIDIPQIAINEANIATNVSDISSLTLVVSTNTSSISTNAAAIAAIRQVTTGGVAGQVLTTDGSGYSWQDGGGSSSDDLDDVCDRGATTDQVITAGGFIGNLTGNADTVTTNANLTGEVTSVGNTTVLDPTAISNKADTTIVAADYLLFWDATDSTLKKVDAAELMASADTLDNVCDRGSVTDQVITAGGFTTTGTATIGNLDVDTININGNVISDSTGTISFDDEIITTTGSFKNLADNSKHYFGASDDYYIEWTGTNAVHTITTGAFNFDGGAIRLPVFTTTERDALTPVDGMVIYNSTEDEHQKYEDGSWIAAGLPKTGTPGYFLKKTTVGSVWSNVTTATISAAGFIGPLTGNADTVTTNANLTGEVTSVGNAAVLDPTSISNKADTTIASADYLLFWDATDSTLKKVDAAELMTSADDLDDVCDRGATTDQVIVAGGFTTTGSFKNLADDSKHYFGAADDYNITWDGTNAVHTITTGSFEFDGGPIRLPTMTTAVRDALTPADGMVIYNTTTDHFEFYEDGIWQYKPNAITTATDYYVTTTGNDTTGDGSSGSPWATVDKALAVLGTMILIANVTINIEAGAYSTSTDLTIKHSQGGFISISGDYYYDSGAALTSTTDNGTYVDYTFTSGDSTKYTVGDLVLCVSSSGGTNPEYVIGSLEVISVSAPSVVLRKPLGNFSAGAVVANIAVPMVKWVRKIIINSSIKLIQGIQVHYNCLIDTLLIYINPEIPTMVRLNLCLFYNTSATRYGTYRQVNNCYVYLYMVGFCNMYYAIVSQSVAKFEYTGCTNCSYGFYVYIGSVVNVAYIHLIGTTNTGITAFGMSTVQPDAVGAILYNNGTDATPVNGYEGNRNSRMDY